MGVQKNMNRKPVPTTCKAELPYNKGGRPTKAAEDINSETFLLYMTPSEINRMRKMHEHEVKLRAVSLNQFIKDRFFELKNPLSITVPKTPLVASTEELNKTLVVLIRIDLNLSRFVGNFNQSAKRINSGMVVHTLKEDITKYVNLLDEMIELKTDIKSIIDELKMYFS